MSSITFLKLIFTKPMLSHMVRLGIFPLISILLRFDSIGATALHVFYERVLYDNVVKHRFSFSFSLFNII